MRSVMSISLPKQMEKIVEDAVKTGQYASKSEFFRDLIRSWSEEQLVRAATKSKREFARGKGRRLQSLKDLGRND